MTKFIFALLVTNTYAHALTPSQVADFGARIIDTNASVRLAAMDELGTLAEHNPEKAGNDVIPMFCKGLKDGDAKVRANAAADLGVIAEQTVPRFRPHKPGFPDLQSYEQLKADLEVAMFDTDPEVRRAALGAYTLTFDLSPEWQAKLINQVPLEESTGLWYGIIESLASCEAPTPATQNFLTQLLDDPKKRPFVIEIFAKRPLSPKIAAPPTAALPKLADMLLKEKDTEKRQALGRVLGRYGAQARPYLKQMEELRDKESDPVTRSNLKAATDAIRAGTPLQE